MKLTAEQKKIAAVVGGFLVIGAAGGGLVKFVKNKIGKKKNKDMISDQAFKDTARKLGVEEATIRAVAKIEGGSKAFYTDTNFPIVRMENHIIKRYCDNNKLQCPDFGKNQTGINEWYRFKKAYDWNKKAAIYSTSFGMFQIMGFNYAYVGWPSLESFYASMSESADEQLKAFVNFVIKKKLVTALKNHDWKAFAKGYNGATYYVLQYDVKLKNAYDAMKKQGF